MLFVWYFRADAIPHLQQALGEAAVALATFIEDNYADSGKWTDDANQLRLPLVNSVPFLISAHLYWYFLAGEQVLGLGRRGRWSGWHPRHFL